MNRKTTALALSLGAFASLCIGVNSAVAGSRADTEKLSISVSDLKTTEGVNRIHGQVLESVQRLCGVRRLGPVNLTERRLQQGCVARVADNFFENTKHRSLRSYHNALDKKERYDPDHAILATWSVNSNLASQSEKPSPKG